MSGLLITALAAVVMAVAMLLYRLARQSEERYRDSGGAAPIDSGIPPAPEMSEEPAKLHLRRFRMQVLITVVGLGVGLYILMAGGYSPAAENVASGLIGSVIGFWLK